MMKRWLMWLFIALAALPIGAVPIARWMWFPGHAFDPIAWKDEDQIRQGVRLGMTDRLIAQRRLLGMTRAEVVELLGEPPPTEYFAKWDMVYWLGPERNFLFSIDSEWLVLRLDKRGRVVDNRIVRD